MSHDLQPEPDELAQAVAKVQELVDYMRPESVTLNGRFDIEVGNDDCLALEAVLTALATERDAMVRLRNKNHDMAHERDVARQEAVEWKRRAEWWGSEMNDWLKAVDDSGQLPAYYSAWQRKLFGTLRLRAEQAEAEASSQRERAVRLEAAIRDALQRILRRQPEVIFGEVLAAALATPPPAPGDAARHVHKMVILAEHMSTSLAQLAAADGLVFCAVPGCTATPAGDAVEGGA